MKSQKENTMNKSEKKLLETFIYDNGKLLWKPAKAYDETVKDLYKEFFKGNVYGKE